jgi:ubiquinone/menaquinone biosynthesis C-methylase UbiE
MKSFASITEAPGQKATIEQISRLIQRYKFARNFGKGNRCLEVACGTGMGLEYLSNDGACFVVGGELDKTNLATASRAVSSAEKTALVQFDAQSLPFVDSCFDMVVCFEAIYYFPDANRFLAEVFRVLHPTGMLVLGTVNCAWLDFHRSPFTTRYFDSSELYNLLRSCFKKVTLYGGFPVENGFRSRGLSLLKRIAMSANLIPGSLRARAVLKRLFMGPLVPLPSRVSDELAPALPPVELPGMEVEKKYKILYAVAEKN